MLGELGGGVAGLDPETVAINGVLRPSDIVEYANVRTTPLALAAVLALLAFVAYDMRHAALAYLGINPAKPAVEFEIRLPKAALSAVADSRYRAP